ncbi:hypothetical protein N7537_011889 [Penicillium hordei]|uniref:Uncharacterized protein n=1 Tax=Penicillium hordei TaxID=40994 RepID=A0AAD6DMQ4_9EURO|nr:uncharacterized protein N7537_011889 [Penicillium hordei]KAJ5589211.1 hypothetical protein N7537_011889 [Penicillium hordei]
MSEQKARVLIVGTGSFGTMSGYALEQGGKAEVTAVMRSNYEAVKANGVNIDSVQHGNGIRFRPINQRNQHREAHHPRFPTNPIISSVSFVGATTLSHCDILHDDPDDQKIGPFSSPGVPAQVAEDAAKRYIDIYNPHGKLDLIYDADVRRCRWRKLLYNGSYNPVSTILRMDTPRMRMSAHVIDDLIRPIMKEILAAARADIVTDFTDNLVESDIEKGNLFEVENIVEETLREGEAKSVPMPTLRTVYGILKGLQLQFKESKGLWKPKFTVDNPYQ